MEVKLRNENLPANHQGIDDIPLEKDIPMIVREVPVGTENKRVFKVSSSSEVGTFYEVRALKTIAGTEVFKCECIGYKTRERINPFFECKHIRLVKGQL
jgi:hypothetical protein